MSQPADIIHVLVVAAATAAALTGCSPSGSTATEFSGNSELSQPRDVETVVTCGKDGNSAAARFGFHASHLEVLPDFMLESLVALPDRVPEGISSGGYLAVSYELPDKYGLYFSDGLRFRNGCGTLLIFSRREDEKLEISPTSRPGGWLNEASSELAQAYHQALQRCEVARPSAARRLGYCIAFDPYAIIATEGGTGYGVGGEAAVAAHTLEFTLSSPNQSWLITMVGNEILLTNVRTTQ